MKRSLFLFAVLPLMILLSLYIGCSREKGEAESEMEAIEDLELENIPAVVMNALKAKFPKAEIQKWTQEKEGDVVIFDFEFTQEGWKFEADIKADGGIYNWEKAVAETDLPEVVKKAVQNTYPNSTIKEIMQITAVVDGEEAPEGFEIMLETAAKKEVEVTVAPDGKILEDSGEMK